MKTLKISELFYSIQGESTYAGLPCLFVRLAGCNLRCNYCDAKYTYEDKYQEMSIEDILSYIDAYPGVMVEITGGEPLIQDNIYELIDKILAKGRIVLLETNGSISIENVPLAVNIIMDVKCPGSGDASLDSNNLETIKKRSLSSHNEIKFVLSNDSDYQWAKNITIKNDLISFLPVLFSPINGRLESNDLAEMILTDRLPVRLQIQLHTILWPNKKRGF